MGLRKKASAEKKEVPVSRVSQPQGSLGNPSENEIDRIFGKKKKRIAPENEEIPTEDGIGSGKRVKKAKVSSDGKERRKGGKQSRAGKTGKSSSSAAELPPKPRKKTADGMTIYGEDELKWNARDAGGTPLCPFDCECCF